MKIQQTKQEGLKYEYSVTVPAKEISQQFDAKLNQAAGQVKMPGFRPGKVPLNIVKKKHGESLMAEVLEHTVEHSVRDLFKQQNLRPAMQPKIDVVSFAEGKDLEFNIAFETYPEVPEVDMKGIKLERLAVEVADKDVEEALSRIAKVNREFAKPAKARASKKGDVVVIDFLGRVEGEAFEGGTANDYRLELGSGQFIPGFEDQLEGKKEGEKVDVKVTFPKEYGHKKLAGQPAVFEVTVKEIQEGTDPAIDDELAKKMGLESLEKLKEEIIKQTKLDFDGVSHTRLKRDLFDALDKTCKFEVPESMVEEEFKSLIKQAIREEGEPKDEKAKKKQEAEYRKLSERRVRLGILLANIGYRQKIEITADEARQAVFAQARQYPGQEQRVLDFYHNNPSALEQLKGPILEDKVVDYLLKNVETKEKKLSSEEMLKLLEKERKAEE